MKSRKKHSTFDKKLKKAILILIVLYVGQGMGKGMFASRTITFYNTTQADVAEEIDVCGLDVISCDGVRGFDEDKEAGLPQKLRRDGAVAKKSGGEGEDIVTLIRSTFPEDPDTAVAIAKAESGLRTDAKGDMHIQFWQDGVLMGHSCGLFQIRVLPGRPDCETLKDPVKNIKKARQLYESSGWQPWSAYTNESYKKYL